MTPAQNVEDTWPALPLDAWRDTLATLHMWTQVVGKLSLAMTPLVNHYWNAAFRITPRGLATPPLPAGDRSLTITFDFIDHRLLFECSDGKTETIALEPRTVAEFYASVMATLRRFGVEARIWTLPSEVADPIPFEKDTVHRSYDAARANAHWRALLAMQPVLENFRSRFIGKCSPVHFFWGSFDVAVTRFSGKRAPEQPDANSIMREAYSHEVISHGFWPGGGAMPEAAFYAYAKPEPEGFSAVRVEPSAAYYGKDLKLFILPYDAVRNSVSPETELTTFLESTYKQAARLAKWNRGELER